MKKSLLLTFIILFNLDTFSQFKCEDLFYNSDSLVVTNDLPYSGSCNSFTKKGKLESVYYYGYGTLDSVVYFDKNGIKEAIEPYINNMLEGTVKSYYKSGAIKKQINYKKGKCFGFWREYYEAGQPKYEAEYVANEEFKNNSYYTWTKKGTKYLHHVVGFSKEKHRGSLVTSFSYERWKKTKVK